MREILIPDGVRSVLTGEGRFGRPDGLVPEPVRLDLNPSIQAELSTGGMSRRQALKVMALLGGATLTNTCAPKAGQTLPAPGVTSEVVATATLEPNQGRAVLSTAEPTAKPTQLPGGPETSTNVIKPWPSTLAQIPEQRPAFGGQFAVEGSNVDDQQADVEILLVNSGFEVLKVANQQDLEEGQVLLSRADNSTPENPHPTRWSIAIVSSDGFAVPLVHESMKTVPDLRPDWATDDVTGFTILKDRLGKGFMRGWELIDDHWVPVTRTTDGKRVAFFDINQSTFVYEAVYDPNEIPADLESYEGNIQLWLNPEYNWGGKLMIADGSQMVLLDELAAGFSVRYITLPAVAGWGLEMSSWWASWGGGWDGRRPLSDSILLS